MPLAIEPTAPPLRIDESGAIRVGGTRVTLGTVIEAYLEGESAEVIVESFPSLSLAEVHRIIAYYLENKAEVDAYLDDRRRRADELRRAVEAMPGHAALVEKLRGCRGHPDCGDRNPAGRA